MLGGKFYGYMWFMKSFFFIIYVLVSESLFGLVKLDDLDILLGC